MEVKYSEDLKHAYFNGIEFYRKCDYYFNGKHGKLHRYIYSYFNGPIEKGYDVHHIDENKLNNDISNLTLLTHSEHTILHKTGEKNPFYNKHLSEEHKQKMSESLKGRKAWNEIKITDEMIFDYKNGIKRKVFCNKYDVSITIWTKLRKQIQAD